MGILLIIWVAAAGVAVLASRRRAHVGLVAIFIASLAMYYWVAPLLYLLPWYQPLDDPAIVQLGLRESTIAVVAFAIGAVLLAPRLLPHRPRGAMSPGDPSSPAHAEAERIGGAYVAVGVLCYVALQTVLSGVPTATALASSGQQLVLVGLCVLCWSAWKRGERRRFAWLVASVALFPIVTIITQGFLGYGALPAIAVIIFAGFLARPRPRVILAGAVVVYLAVSLFMTYFGARSVIRSVVWSSAPYSARIAQVGTSLADFQWFNPHDETQLQFVDGRLNQDYLVGSAVSYLAGTQDFAHGRTIWQAAEALVPRVLWPSKPVFAGSGNLVSHYTGIHFAQGTSVGIGAVMELYVNFATPGVAIGFLLFGVALGMLDAVAARSLAAGDARSFGLVFLVGVGFLILVGGSLVGFTATTGASLIVGLVVNRVLLPRRHAPAPARGSLSPGTGSR